MKTAAIIQARMGSTRLPGKMMMKIAGKPVVWHEFDRITSSQKIDAVLLATTTNTEDDVLAHWAKENDVVLYRGSAVDVLDRYYHAARELGADIIVRLTGDCPLLDPAIIDAVIGEYEKGGCDYISSGRLTSTFPDGLDTEVFSFAALKKAWQEARRESDREHVTPYIWRNPGLFRVKTFDNAENLSHLRLTLDTPSDLELLTRVIEESGRIHRPLGMHSVVELLNEHPEWLLINSDTVRNAGYHESVKSDSGNNV